MWFFSSRKLHAKMNKQKLKKKNESIYAASCAKTLNDGL